MKKLIASLSLFCALGLFAGCGGGGLFSSPDTREKLEAPVCILADDYLYWTPVENAVSYTVSLNGKERTAQKACGIELDTAQDMSVKVRANASEDSSEYKDSAYSAVVLRTADPVGYIQITEENLAEYAEIEEGSDFDTVTLDGSNEAYEFRFAADEDRYLFRIPAEVRLVRIHTGGKTLYAALCILTRSDPLILEMNGAFLNAPRDMCAVYSESLTALPDAADLVVRSRSDGDARNVIYGGNNSKDGAAGKEGGGIAGEGGKGGNGNPGYAGINVPSVVFSGDEALSVYGGDGSDGGRGGSGKWGLNQGGDGGDGGNGADAVVADKLYLKMDGGSELSLLGGRGGARGDLGSGLNLGTKNNAKNGVSGAGYRGTPVVISGMLG